MCTYVYICVCVHVYNVHVLTHDPLAIKENCDPSIYVCVHKHVWYTVELNMHILQVCDTFMYFQLNFQDTHCYKNVCT